MDYRISQDPEDTFPPFVFVERSRFCYTLIVQLHTTLRSTATSERVQEVEGIPRCSPETKSGIRDYGEVSLIQF